MPAAGGLPGPVPKAHFEVLDGLRGSAALLIVTFHAFNYAFNFQGPWALVPHAYLAVDFFFALSGFVVAFAYDDRWPTMSVGQFYRLRLIRLHPLVLLGATMGLLVYLFDPYAPASDHTPVLQLALVYVMSLLLLPSPAVGGRPDETQALNGPAWSLMQEYLGNVAYALILRRLRPAALAVVAAVAAAGLAWAAQRTGSLEGGWDYPRIGMAPVRLATSFVLGLWLYRISWRVRLPKLGLLALSVLLLVCFQMPAFRPAGALSLNGLYDTACVLLLFPLIILCGAHSEVGSGMLGLCRFAGRLSYPLYITHIGCVYVLAHYAQAHHPGTPLLVTAILGVMALSVIVGWLALIRYDEPVRAWLTRRYRGARAGSAH
jgi:peptidoglycan/LPS O-acetylase OafA/YrhL